MSRAKHTPGPWSWSEDMAVNSPGEVARTLDAVGGSVLYHNAGWDVKAADRALLSAATELLEAIKPLMRPGCGEPDCACGPSSKALRDAEKAVAKAEGK